MSITLWVVSWILALAFVGGGLIKLAQRRERLVASGQAWAQAFPASLVKGVGLLEVLGGIGLVLPGLAGVATILVPAAAAGIAALMGCAAVIHLRRAERRELVVTLVIGAVAVAIAVARSSTYGL